jgi:hypothetical protein
MLQAALAAQRRVLGSAHPDTLATARYLESVQWHMRAKHPTKKGVKAAARKERAAASPLSPTALAEAEAMVAATEAELLAMLELEEVGSACAAHRAQPRARRRARRRARQASADCVQ